MTANAAPTSFVVVVHEQKRYAVPVDTAGVQVGAPVPFRNLNRQKRHGYGPGTADIIDGASPCSAAPLPNAPLQDNHGASPPRAGYFPPRHRNRPHGNRAISFTESSGEEDEHVDLLELPHTAKTTVSAVNTPAEAPQPSILRKGSGLLHALPALFDFEYEPPHTPRTTPAEQHSTAADAADILCTDTDAPVPLKATRPGRQRRCTSPSDAPGARTSATASLKSSRVNSDPSLRFVMVGSLGDTAALSRRVHKPATPPQGPPTPPHPPTPPTAARATPPAAALPHVLLAALPPTKRRHTLPLPRPPSHDAVVWTATHTRSPESLSSTQPTRVPLLSSTPELPAVMDTAVPAHRRQRTPEKVTQTPTELQTKSPADFTTRPSSQQAAEMPRRASDLTLDADGIFTASSLERLPSPALGNAVSAQGDMYDFGELPSAPSADGVHSTFPGRCLVKEKSAIPDVGEVVELCFAADAALLTPPVGLPFAARHGSTPVLVLEGEHANAVSLSKSGSLSGGSLARVPRHGSGLSGQTLDQTASVSPRPTRECSYDYVSLRTPNSMSASESVSGLQAAESLARTPVGAAQQPLQQQRQQQQQQQRVMPVAAPRLPPGAIGIVVTQSRRTHPSLRQRFAVGARPWTWKPLSGTAKPMLVCDSSDAVPHIRNDPPPSSRAATTTKTATPPERADATEEHTDFACTESYSNDEVTEESCEDVSVDGEVCESGEQTSEKTEPDLHDGFGPDGNLDPSTLRAAERTIALPATPPLPQPPSQSRWTAIRNRLRQPLMISPMSDSESARLHRLIPFHRIAAKGCEQVSQHVGGAATRVTGSSFQRPTKKASQ